MVEMNRREMLVAFGALAAFGGGVAGAQAGPAGGPDGKLSQPTVFEYDKLPVKHNANGGESRQVFSGTLVTGEFMEVHETTLPPGQEPHPPHRHSHSEVLLIREGHLEYSGDGKLMPVGPGGVVFSASHVLHGLKNTGTVMASYFVVAVGVQKAES